MSFVYLFDLVEFDKNGNVCESKNCTLAQSRSNFLYLICKYNQNFLQAQNQEIPAFFKEELSSVLSGVEGGKDFEKAKATVLKNCLPCVQNVAERVKSEKEFVSALNDMVTLKDKEFADKFKKVTNNLQLEYIITMTSGNIFEGIVQKTSQPNFLADQKTKSKVFKDAIKYNSLVATAEKVKQNNLSVEQVKQMAS